jgi:hypothetical protein
MIRKLKESSMSRLSIFKNPYEEFFKEDFKESLRLLKSKINDILNNEPVDWELLEQLSSYYFDVKERARLLGIISDSLKDIW